MGRISGADYDKAADWSFFAGDVPEALVTPERDWSLAAIIFTTSAYTKVAISQIRMDDFTAFASGLPNDGVVVENFEEPRQWLPVGTTARVPDTLDAGPSGARTGNGGITFTWSDPAGGEQRGIHHSPRPSTDSGHRWRWIVPGRSSPYQAGVGVRSGGSQGND